MEQSLPPAPSEQIATNNTTRNFRTMTQTPKPRPIDLETARRIVDGPYENHLVSSKQNRSGNMYMVFDKRIPLEYVYHNQDGSAYYRFRDGSSMYYYVDGRERFEPFVNVKGPPVAEQPANTVDTVRAPRSDTNAVGRGLWEQSSPVKGDDAELKKESHTATSA